MVKTKVDGSTVEELERRVTDVEQNASGMQITISSVRDAVDKQEQDLENYKLETSIYLRFTEKGLSIGKQNAGDESPYSIVIDNEKMSFQQNGMEVAYIQYNKMHINAIEAMDKLSVGPHQMVDILILFPHLREWESNGEMYRKEIVYELNN